jgi:hypothetical protein
LDNSCIVEAGIFCCHRRSLLGPQKPKIDIELQEERAAHATGNSIRGFVFITAEYDCFIEDPEIRFQGLVYQTCLKLSH